MEDLETRFSKVANDTILRGDRGYGRKTSANAMARVADGPVSVHHYSDSEGTMTIETVQDCGAIVEANKRDQSSGHDGYSPSRDWRHVARIPKGIVEMFYNQGINLLDSNSLPFLKAMLDDPNWSHLRSNRSKLSSKPYREFTTARTRRRKN